MILCPECHKIVDTFWVAANKCANALMGPLMKKTNGMADPVVAKRLMLERLMEE